MDLHLRNTQKSYSREIDKFAEFVVATETDG